jgi:DNA-directed RNA polymerase specialized sigma24 family protein
MPTDAREESTDDLVHKAARGDRDAMNRLFEHLYPEVRKIVVSLLRGRRNSVEATDVVVRVWEKLIKQRDPKWKDRTHFLRFVVMVVRRVIADLPIAPESVTLSGELGLADRPSVTLRDFDECLTKLEQRGHIGSRVVIVLLLRSLAKLKWDEIAEVVDVAPRTAKGDFALGAAYLRTCLNRSS